MKSAIIATVDALAYLAFGIVLLVGLVMMGQGNVGAAMAVLVGGWFGCCLVFGAWFLLSNINDSLQKIANSQ
jgi:hypothetical protein